MSVSGKVKSCGDIACGIKNMVIATPFIIGVILVIALLIYVFLIPSGDKNPADKMDSIKNIIYGTKSDKLTYDDPDYYNTGYEYKKRKEEEFKKMDQEETEYQDSSSEDE